MKKGIEDLAVEIVEKFYQGEDKSRKHELVNATRISLNRLANRIDRGFNIEVRMEPVKKADQKEEGSKDLAEKIQVIQEASRNMHFMKLEGAPILQLPEVFQAPPLPQVSPSLGKKK